MHSAERFCAGTHQSVDELDVVRDDDDAAVLERPQCMRECRTANANDLAQEGLRYHYVSVGWMYVVYLQRVVV
jgi:hypothetical protein